MSIARVSELVRASQRVIVATALGCREFSVGDPVTGHDLSSVPTHELGHFFGLDHTGVEGATMETAYAATDDLRRSLEPDDITGICAVYPPSERPPRCPARRATVFPSVRRRSAGAAGTSESADASETCVRPRRDASARGRP